MSIISLLKSDSYKFSHIGMFVPNTNLVYSHVTPRNNKYLKEMYPDIPDTDLDLDSAISDNYRQVDNFDSLVEGLSSRQKAIVSHLFDTGELSFVCS